MDVKEANILGDKIIDHWYYKSKSKAILKFISKISPSSILDIGSGSGFFSKFILQNTSASSAYCVDINYQKNFNEEFLGKKIFFKKSLNTNIQVNLVILIDVLEHVEDDVDLLKEYINYVPSGTKFLISVPAFQFLWSNHDVFLDHKRRYNIKQLESVIKLSGLELEKSSYYFGLIFPIVFFLRLFKNFLKNNKTKTASDLKLHSPVTNLLLSLICRIELIFFEYNRLLGLSIFCLGKKK